MTTDISEAPATGIGKLLQDNRFMVPNHQRDYSWTDHEAEQLIDDIEDAVSRNSSEYFLGLMVFMHSNSGHLIVLDGQQRLATVVIILSAIRNWLQQYSAYKDDANSVQDRFIGSREFGERTITPNLIMNAANNQTFNSYVVSSVAQTDIVSACEKLKPQDRNKRLLESVVYAHTKISAIANRFSSPDGASAYFFKLLVYLRDKVSVVRLTVRVGLGIVMAVAMSGPPVLRAV